MHILVTGGAGFIGSHIVDAYINKGHRVVVVDHMREGVEKNVNPKATLVNLSVLDTALDSVFKDYAFDVVNHHAAQVKVGSSVNDPVDDAKTNIMGLLNILQLCAKYKVKKIIFASSAAVYGEQKRLPITEKTKFNVQSPYAVSKLSSEYYIQAYAKLYGIKYTIFRYANVYGERQSIKGAGAVIPTFIANMIKGERSMMFGQGLQTRDFIYVKDVAEANLLALKEGKNQILNIGSGTETTLLSLYKELRSITGYDKEPIFAPERKGDIAKSYFAVAKAQQKLKWTPKTPLSEGLKATVEWMKSQIQDEKAVDSETTTTS